MLLARRNCRVSGCGVSNDGKLSKMPFFAWLCIGLGLSLAYALVFIVTETLIGWREAGLWAVSNAAPHVIFAVPLVDRIAPQLTKQRLLMALSVAIAAVMFYALSSYGSAVFLLALTGGVRTDGIFVRFFSGPALPWQIFQGSAYGIAALLGGMWLDARHRLDCLVRETAPVGTKPQRWLVKTADGIVPIEPAEILRIEAAGEYSRIVLPTGTILSRIGIAACEERLGSQAFLRVHRSHIIRADAIVRAEPAGNGRLQLSLCNGDQLISSREGARLVRSAAI